jgi:hypothetical protein
LVGGIILKLEPTCLERFFPFACKTSRVDDVLLGGEECSCMALVDKNSDRENIRARVANAADQLFIVYCIKM